MNKANSPNPFQRIHQNSGVVLFIALMFLLVSTILGVSALRANFFNEKMTLNTLQREQTLEAAEIALLEGEQFVENFSQQIIAAVISDTTADPITLETGALSCAAIVNNGGGVCVPRERFPNPKNHYHNWKDITGDSKSINAWSTGGRHRSTSQTMGLNTAPKYIVEFCGFITDTNGDSVCGVEVSPGVPHPKQNQLDRWPYCDLDRAQFRITAQATAGNYDATRVMLQSTYVVNGSAGRTSWLELEVE